jgi:hypothetical protein
MGHLIETARRPIVRRTLVMVAVALGTLGVDAGLASAMTTSNVNFGSVPLGVTASAKYLFDIDSGYASEGEDDFGGDETGVFAEPTLTCNTVFSNVCAATATFTPSAAGPYAESYQEIECPTAGGECPAADDVTLIGQGIVVTGDTLSATPAADVAGSSVNVASVSPCPAGAASQSVSVALDNSSGTSVTTLAPTLLDAQGDWAGVLTLPSSLANGSYFIHAQCLTGPTTNAVYEYAPITIAPVTSVENPDGYASVCRSITLIGITTQYCSATYTYPATSTATAALRNGARAYATADIRGRVETVATGQVKNHKLHLAYRALRPGRYKVALWVMDGNHRASAGHTSMVIS